jgi:hypothetical protein
MGNRIDFVRPCPVMTEALGEYDEQVKNRKNSDRPSLSESWAEKILWDIAMRVFIQLKQEDMTDE